MKESSGKPSNKNRISRNSLKTMILTGLPIRITWWPCKMLMPIKELWRVWGFTLLAAWQIKLPLFYGCQEKIRDWVRSLHVCTNIPCLQILREQSRVIQVENVEALGCVPAEEPEFKKSIKVNLYYGLQPNWPILFSFARDVIVTKVDRNESVICFRGRHCIF